jgi:hypothetical protein
MFINKYPIPSTFENISFFKTVSYVCMYVCVRGGPNQPLHRDPQWSIVLPLLWYVVQDFIRGDVEIVTWFHKISAQVTESQVS